MALSSEIIKEFNRAFKKARVSGEPEPTAMMLATSDGHGMVTSRTVLLKALDEDGFVFFTNTQSLKGQQLGQCPRAAATFLWKASGCQVQLVGPVSQVSDEAADAYFSTRDRGSQIGAWASLQSQPLDSRETLLQRVKRIEIQYAALKCRGHLTGRVSYSVRKRLNSGPSGNFACMTAFFTRSRRANGRNKD